ncbi:hypothetical protein HMPREF9094_1945 [Fusobacterium animalis ATCC 51191]|uniref:Uncharacterized protein n=1 Tax=Fusobacterium animalis ATCC 51191 TaxID=997347 RepID=F9EPU0_9FUSO|nr:hypothetical protein HMPREF9094_1945 [Fusobacterium animalis ATCC 51191]
MFVNQNLIKIKNKTAENLVTNFIIVLNFSSLIKFLVNISSRIYKLINSVIIFF